jgi:hypothetical protein
MVYRLGGAGAMVGLELVVNLGIGARDGSKPRRASGLVTLTLA